MVAGVQLTVDVAEDKAPSSPKTLEDKFGGVSVSRDPTQEEDAAQSTESNLPLKLVTSILTYKTEFPEDEERDAVDERDFDADENLPTKIIFWSDDDEEDDDTRDSDSHVSTTSHSNITTQNSEESRPVAQIARAPRAEDHDRHFGFEGYSQTFTDDCVTTEVEECDLELIDKKYDNIQVKITDTIWKSFLSILPEGGGCLSPTHAGDGYSLQENPLFQAVSCVNETIDTLEKLKDTSTQSASATDELIETKVSSLQKIDTDVREEEMVIELFREEKEKAEWTKKDQEELCVNTPNPPVFRTLRPTAEFMMPLRPTLCHSWQSHPGKPRSLCILTRNVDRDGRSSSLLDDMTLTPAPSDEMEFLSREMNGELVSALDQVAISVGDNDGPFNAFTE